MLIIAAGLCAAPAFAQQPTGNTPANPLADPAPPAPPRAEAPEKGEQSAVPATQAPNDPNPIREPNPSGEPNIADPSAAPELREKPLPAPGAKDAQDLDPETLRLIEEVAKRMVREKEAKAAAEKKLAEDAERKKAADNSLWRQLGANTQILVGAEGTVSAGLNSVYGPGFGFGGFFDFIVQQRYGLRLGAATGKTTTKAVTLRSGNYLIPIPAEGALGYWMVESIAFYAFPKWGSFEANAGAGLALYQMRGGNYSFGTILAPKLLLSCYYALFSRLQVGVSVALLLPSASRVESGGAEYALNTSQALTAVHLMAAVRYSLWQ